MLEFIIKKLINRDIISQSNGLFKWLQILKDCVETGQNFVLNVSYIFLFKYRNDIHWKRKGVLCVGMYLNRRQFVKKKNFCI